MSHWTPKAISAARPTQECTEIRWFCWPPLSWTIHMLTTPAIPHTRAAVIKHECTSFAVLCWSLSMSSRARYDVAEIGAIKPKAMVMSTGCSAKSFQPVFIFMVERSVCRDEDEQR